MLKTFDGANRLKRAIELVDSRMGGMSIVLPKLADDDPILRKYTVYKNKAGKEMPLAFGLTSGEARGFIAVAKWRMTQLNIEGAGDAYFDATTFRVGEDNEL